MKKVWILVGLVFGCLVGYVTSQVIIIQRPLSSVGLSSGVGYGTRLPVVTDDGRPPTDGELFVVRNVNTEDPLPYMYSARDGSWNLLTEPPIRETFTFANVEAHVEEDYTAAVNTDNAENIILLGNSKLGPFHYRIEAGAAGTLAATVDPFSDGVLSLVSLVDDTDNEGVEITFGGDRGAIGYQFDEDSTASVYCETVMTIGDVSETDSVYFGWFLTEAYQDLGAVNAHNTYAIFHVLASGDVDIETELNAGGTLADDLGTDWVDAAQHRLRVTMSANSVAFSFNGTAIAQTNAVLNADDGDEFRCGMGQLNATGDATPEPSVSATYVEIGVVNN